MNMAQRRHLSDEALVHISAVYAENRGAYGWPRIRGDLRARCIRMASERVPTADAEARDSSARGKRRFRVLTSDSNTVFRLRQTCLIASSAWGNLGTGTESVWPKVSH